VKTPHFLRALSSRNYRIYFGGQCVSLLGSWMTTTASFWLVYHLSSNPVYVGLVVFANQIPVLLLAPFAGVWLDRADRLRVMQATQLLSMVQSAALALLTLTGHITVARMIGLCLFQGFINGFDWPVRQTLTFELVDDKSHVENVVALNSITFSGARLIGPAIAGFVIAGFGPGACYAVDALSFLGVLAALLSLRLTPRPPRLTASHPVAELREGIRYAWGVPTIRTTLLMVPVISLVGFVHVVLAPVFARDVFFGDARLLGFLMAATGVGALLAGLFLSMRPRGTHFTRVIAAGAALGGGGLLLLGASPWLPLALFSMMAAGAGGVLVMASGNSLLQTLVPDDKRGRVMSLFSMGQVTFPLGSLLAGYAAAAAGPRPTVAACGAICLAAAAVYARNSRAPGVQSALRQVSSIK
jgi:MFS family permease